MSEAPTRADILEAIEAAKRHAVIPCQVKTWRQAIWWTFKSRFSRIWRKGDEYYIGMIR